MGSIATPSLVTMNQIESFEHIDAYGERNAPVVTMFSGGLDSTYLLFKLQQLGFHNIHAIAVDVGDSIDQAKMTKVAARFGAKFVYLDGRKEFAEKGVKPAIRAQAKYLGNYPLSSSLSRPVIARCVTDYAKCLNSRLLLHTANLSQNSLPRLNNSIQRYEFPGLYGSPYVLSVVSRERKAAELAHAGLTFMSERKLSGDENLWCREFESGPLDDPEAYDIPEDAYHWTQCGSEYATEKIRLGFQNGELVSVNDKEIALIDAVMFLNKTVGKSLFRDPKFTILFASGAITTFPLFVPPFFVPLYTNAVSLPSSAGAGLVAGFNFASAIGRLGCGYACDVMGSLNALFLTLVLNAVTLLVIWPLSDSVGPLIPFVILNGMANGGFFVIMPTIVRNLFGSSRVSVAMGMIVTGWLGGYLLGAPIAGFILHATGDDSTIESYRPAIFWAGGMAAISAILVGVARILVSRALIKV